MINWLDVRNFVVVKQVQVSFDSGLTVITGETGAGKSVLVDALATLLGNRASAELIRHGADHAEIQADFSVSNLPDARDWLSAMELGSEVGECTLRRLIYRDKPSRGFINGKPVPIQSLRDLGSLLADIHAQHEHHRLLRRDVQRDLLDSNAGILGELGALSETSARVHDLEARLIETQAGLEERQQREAFLRHQVDELTALNPDPDELEDLEAKHSRLAHTRELAEGVWSIVQDLDQAENASVSDTLNRVRHQLTDLAAYDNRLEPLSQQVDELAAQVGEIVSELQPLSDGYDLDPAELERVDQRLGALHDMSRKYRTPPQELKALLGRLDTELSALDSAAHDPERLRKELEAAENAYDVLATKISAARGEAALKMSEAVNAQLPSLGLEAATFRIRLEDESKNLRGPWGRESVYFELRPGSDLEFAALERAASGGELSRVSLAIQLTGVTETLAPCTIYDEVDVGIGGRVAEIVGQKLRSTADHRQVFCITHLPQVAAQGHHHLQVSRINGDETQVTIKLLDSKARSEELARMLGGVEITQATRAHAAELLARAAQ